MPLQEPQKLVRSVEGGERGGIFFLFGDEEFLKEEAAARLVAAHLDPATRDFNFDQIRGGDAEAQSLASVIQTPPMMAEYRVVVVQEAQALAGSATLRGVIESALDRPPSGLALILMAQLPPRSRAKFYEDLKKRARAAEFALLSHGDVPGWLMARAAADGFELEPDAARVLAAAIGTELGPLVQELGKLREYAGERRRVTAADIEAVVGPIARQNRWEWFDLVGAGRFAEARGALPVLLDAGESGVGLVIGLGTHLLRLALVAAGGEGGLAAELPPHQKWLASRIARQARAWSTERLDAALEDLLRADRLLKSASLGDQQVVEEALLRMQSRVAA